VRIGSPEISKSKRAVRMHIYTYRSSLGFLVSALAIEIRYFWPPESERPECFRGVAYPNGRDKIKSWILAERQAEWRSESGRSSDSGIPRVMLSRMVSSNKEGSWATSERVLRYVESGIVEIGEEL
jgi:hypothetical protein